jgi:Domain of unknown function (DUF3883)
MAPSKREPVVLLFTDPDNFYRDGFDSESGLYRYSGMGAKGDMQWGSENRAVRDHVQDGRTLLLFDQVDGKGGLRKFMGPAHLVSHRVERRKDKTGEERAAFVFSLRIDGNGEALDQDSEAVTAAAEEARERRGFGQGFRTSPKANRAVERHAVERAVAYYEGRGFKVVEHGKPFDLEATKDGETIYVEVKGTTTDGRSVLLSRNEVIHFQTHHPRTALYVVYGIQVKGTPDEPRAEAGTERLIEPWLLMDDRLTVMTWGYVLPD